jgi:hypothetical protein
MTHEPVAYINVEERTLEWAAPVVWNTPTVAQMDKVPLFTHQYSDLTDEEIAELSDTILCYQIYDNKESGVFEFARAILRKAQEK